MPLLKGSSQRVIDRNTKELIRSGKDPKQASAIAHDFARRQKVKKQKESR